MIYQHRQADVNPRNSELKNHRAILFLITNVQGLYTLCARKTKTIAKEKKRIFPETQKINKFHSRERVSDSDFEIQVTVKRVQMVNSAASW